jgi:hypothetical protein
MSELPACSFTPSACCKRAREQAAYEGASRIRPPRGWTPKHRRGQASQKVKQALRFILCATIIFPLAHSSFPEPSPPPAQDRAPRGAWGVVDGTPELEDEEHGAPLSDSVSLRPSEPLERALTFFANTTAAAPGIADNWHGLAIVLRRAERFSEAVGAIQHAIALEPSSAIYRSRPPSFSDAPHSCASARRPPLAQPGARAAAPLRRRRGGRSRRAQALGAARRGTDPPLPLPPLSSYSFATPPSPSPLSPLTHSRSGFKPDLSDGAAAYRAVAAALGRAQRARARRAHAPRRAADHRRAAHARRARCLPRARAPRRRRAARRTRRVRGGLARRAAATEQGSGGPRPWSHCQPRPGRALSPRAPRPRGQWPKEREWRRRRPRCQPRRRCRRRRARSGVPRGRGGGQRGGGAGGADCGAAIPARLRGPPLAGAARRRRRRRRACPAQMPGAAGADRGGRGQVYALSGARGGVGLGRTLSR